MTCNIKRTLSNIALYIAIAISGVVLIYSMSNASYAKYDNEYSKLYITTGAESPLIIGKANHETH